MIREALMASSPGVGVSLGESPPEVLGAGDSVPMVSPVSSL